MERFVQCAFVSVACDAAFAVIAAVPLMYIFSADPALALKIGAGIALAFSLRLIYRLSDLHKKGICHTEIWQLMEPDELPREAPAIRGAQEHFEVLLLRFARTSAGIAVALFGTVFLMSMN